MTSGIQNTKAGRISKLELANEMYKLAFTVKKQKFHLMFPHLNDAELNTKTATYLRELPQD